MATTTQPKFMLLNSIFWHFLGLDAAPPAYTKPSTIAALRGWMGHERALRIEAKCYGLLGIPDSDCDFLGGRANEILAEMGMASLYTCSNPL